MNKYSVKEVGRGLYEVTTPTRSVIIDNCEVRAILDFFREREWEAEIREAIDLHPEFELKDTEEFVTEVLEEIKGLYEIYGEYDYDTETLVMDMYGEE